MQERIEIELNVSHNHVENYRPLNKLSTGQKCTAILHLLMLDNQDPLIMDQPEDCRTACSKMVAATFAFSSVGCQPKLKLIHSMHIPFP